MTQVEATDPFHGTEANLRFSLTMYWDVNTLEWVKGTQATGGGGGGSATEYSEDAAAPANPTAPAQVIVRKDTPAAEAADGDWVARRGTAYGAAYVTLLDAAGAPVGVGGDATAANQTTIIGHLDGVEGLLTTIDADTSALAAVDYATGADVASLAVVGGGTEATALRVTLASDSTGVVSVDDNGGSLTVDGTVAVSGAVAVTDNAGSLTIDAPVATPVFVRLSDGAAAISTLPVSLASVPSHAVTNAGTFVVQVDGSALTALQKIDDPVLVDDAGFTPATSSVMMAGFEADESSTDSVDEGDAGAARMTLDRKQIVTLQPHTTGGLSTFMASGSDGSSILVATAQAIKASAGQLYGYYAYNPEAAVTFVHFYNTAAASVTVGTTNPHFTIAIPAGSAANLSIPQGITFSNAGWSCAATTTAGGNTAPATGVSLVCWYA